MTRTGIVITAVKVRKGSRWLSDKWLRRSKKELYANPHRKRQKFTRFVPQISLEFRVKRRAARWRVRKPQALPAHGNIVENLHDIAFGNNLLAMTPKP